MDRPSNIGKEAYVRGRGIGLGTGGVVRHAACRFQIQTQPFLSACLQVEYVSRGLMQRQSCALQES